MGLIRTAAVVAVAITLIPADPQHRAQLYAKAHDGVTWTVTFCDRNEETCERGLMLRESFMEKAAFAASAAYNLAIQHLTDEGDRGSGMQNALAQNTAHRLEHRGTLTDRDRRPHWRGHH